MKSRTFRGRKKLNMMRTRGLDGPFATNHIWTGGYAFGDGGTQTSARALRGWTGLEACGGSLPIHMIVGNSGNLYGWRAPRASTPIGQLAPEEMPTGQFVYIANTSANLFALIITGDNVSTAGQQYLGATTIVAEVQGFGNMNLTWEVNNSRYTENNPALHDFIVSLTGQRLSFNILSPQP